MVTVPQFARAVVPRGTTARVLATREIANVHIGSTPPESTSAACWLEATFVTLSFLALAVITRLKIIGKGWPTWTASIACHCGPTT
jgi:adenine deaminase